MVALLVAVLLFSGGVFAQQGSPRAPAKKPAPGAKPCPKDIDLQTCERGWQLLEAAEAEAGGLRDAGMRAYMKSQIARAYVTSDKSKAVLFLSDAFTVTLDMASDNNIETAQKDTLQSDILSRLAPLAPERVEEFIPQARPSPRRSAFRALLGYYEKDKRFDAALEMINRIAGEGDFPYEAASSLMHALPEDKAAERQQLFTAALNSFRTRPPARNSYYFGSGDFPDLVVNYWKDIPVPLVREAIDEVLKQAKESADPNANAVGVTLGYRDGGESRLSSMYDYRLFQLLPVMRQIDPAYAESLLKDHESVAKDIDSYAKAGGLITFISFGSSYPGPRRTQTQLKADPVAHPDDALEQVLALRDPEHEASLLLAFARTALEKNSAAKDFLDKLVKTVAPQLKSPRDQARVCADAAGLYLKLKDNMGAQNAIAAANAAAEKLYADDTDSDRPNRALKAYWPSTSVSIRLVRLAGRISPNSALTMIKETRDDEIRSVLRLALAGSWIAIPLGSLTEISKDGGWSSNRDPELR